MADTANNVISGALRRLGIVPEEQDVPASMQIRGLEIMNDIIDEWGATRAFIPYQTRLTLPLVQNQEVYTIGNGAYDLDTNQLMDVLEMVINDSTSVGVNYPIIPMDEQRYYNIPYVNSTGIPGQYLLRRYPNYSELHFQPLPYSSTLSANILGKQRVGRVTINQTLDVFPREFLLALKNKLVLNIAAEYGKILPPSQIAMINDSLQKLLAVNLNIDYTCIRDEYINRKNFVFFNWFI